MADRKWIFLWRIFTSVLTLLIVGCNGSSTAHTGETGSIDLTDLLIQTDALPLGWFFGSSGGGIEVDRSTDSVGINFYSDLYPEALGCSENVYRYDSPRLAKRDFQYSVAAFGNGDIPQGWAFVSERANESHFACEYFPNVTFPICKWSARYDRIVIEFRCWLVPGRLTLGDLQSIIEAIDAHAGSLIYGE